jgi:two-component system OmpR family sensor kinase
MRRARVIAIALVPTLLSLAVAFLFERNILDNLFLVGEYRIDAAGLISRIGVLAGGVIVVVLITFWWAERRAVDALQAERRAQADTRRRFFRRLDHELKNPLTIIKIGIANLRNSTNLTAEQGVSLGRVGQQAERLQKLVQDLRWLSELGENRLERYPVDLADVLEEAVALAHTTHQQRALDLSIQQVPWPLAAVSGDRDMLVIVFRNLLDNALKFSTPDDRIKVSATDDGQWANVEVADTGTGISATELPRIFEELYRGENAQNIDGSGLGLALVWRIVNLHGGEISVRSRLGQGTVMSVRLRLSSRES